MEVDVASSSLRDRPHNEHDMGSAETDNLQRANQTEPVVNTNVSDEPPLSIAESSGQTLSLTTVSASSLPDLGEGCCAQHTGMHIVVVEALLVAIYLE
jgi:hypothetical protein